jgi:adenylate kinase
MPLMLMIAGPPGSGKGTLCETIVRDQGLVHISGGDLLRAEITRGSDLGNQAKGFMSRGELVPDDLIIAMILDRLRQDDVRQRGALLDGFPRTGRQAEALKASGTTFDAMILLKVDDEALMERSAGRRLDPETGAIYHMKFKPPPKDIINRLVIRPDDQPDKQRARIAIYKKSKDAIVQVYKNIVVEVNADQPIGAVYREYRSKLKQSSAPHVSKL